VKTALLLVVVTAISCRGATKGDPPPPAPTRAASSPDAASSRLEEPMVCPASLVEARQGGALPNRFVAPTDDERAGMRALFARLLAVRDAAAIGDARADAARIGFEIVEPPDMPGTVVLREVESRRHGGGAYLVRLGSSARLVVQTPHTFYDEGTLPLGCAYFTQVNARALFVNTVHRYKGAQEDAQGQYPADVAHAPGTLFQAATEAAIATIKPISVVQLHGFAAREPKARAVVSTGDKRPNPLVGRVAKALEGTAGAPILRYPEDTAELGATTNVQGTIVRAAGGRFVHVEMDETLRKDLQGDAALRTRTFAALTEALEDK
jgi:hypothetical protein